MNTKRLISVCLSAILLLAGCSKKDDGGTGPVTPITPVVTGPSQVAFWLTNGDKSSLFRKQNVRLNFGTTTNANPTITVDTTQTYQGIDGFGYTMTGASAYVINRMSATNRAALLRELFAQDSTWLGISYLRVSIGASDLSDHVFTYDDLPTGQTDVNLAQFSLAPEQADLIPVLRAVLAINPNIKILGSPWTAPSWMKTNRSPVGGSLDPQYYASYAQYFVKYIQGMAAQGIPIDAVTLQNEPLNENNNPSMKMTANEQASFIGNYVGPAFAAAGLTTKIIAYDHNADQPNYPISVLGNPAAQSYVDGSAFHLYAGSINALTQVHNAFPNKNIYFTEQYVGAPGNFGSDVASAVNNLIIGAPRNWSRNVLEWNLAADPSNGPHTTGGCSTCQPAVTVNSAGVVRNASYYIIAHASKFVRPGSVRVDSNLSSDLPNVAFQTPSGKKVLIVLNSGSAPKAFNIQFRGKTVGSALANGSVGTYVW